MDACCQSAAKALSSVAESRELTAAARPASKLRRPSISAGSGRSRSAPPRGSRRFGKYKRTSSSASGSGSTSMRPTSVGKLRKATWRLLHLALWLLMREHANQMPSLSQSKATGSAGLPSTFPHSANHSRICFLSRSHSAREVAPERAGADAASLGAPGSATPPVSDLADSQRTRRSTSSSESRNRLNVLRAKASDACAATRACCR